MTKVHSPPDRDPYKYCVATYLQYGYGKERKKHDREERKKGKQLKSLITNRGGGDEKK